MMPFTAEQKRLPAEGETITLWGKQKHGPVARGILVELDEDDCIGNPEEHALVRVTEVLDRRRLDRIQPGTLLRFRRPVGRRGYGRNWMPKARGFLRAVGSVRILPEGEATP